MTLERQYRRLTRLYPVEWRHRNEDELVATMLDAAEPERARVSVAEVIDLVGSATVLRLRHRSLARWLGVGGVGLLAAIAILVVGTVRVSGLSVEFLVTSLVVVVIPGTGVVYTVSSSIGGGRQRGLFAAVGCTLGILPHLLAAMLGLSGVMQAGAAAFEVVRWAGVAYLVFMGLSMMRSGGAFQLDDQRTRRADPMRMVVRRGILLNLLNPKLTVFFFAFLPQFLDTPPGLLDTRLVVLGGVFMAMTLAVFVAYAYASAVVRDRVLAAPRVLRWFQQLLGTVLIGFGAKLAVIER